MRSYSNGPHQSHRLDGHTAPEGVLQEERELGVAVWDVRLLRRQRLHHVPWGQYQSTRATSTKEQFLPPPPPSLDTRSVYDFCIQFLLTFLEKKQQCGRLKKRHQINTKDFEEKLFWCGGEQSAISHPHSRSSIDNQIVVNQSTFLLCHIMAHVMPLMRKGK